MNVTINKSVANGNIAAPPSKSLAHRYIICAALSNGKSIIENVDFSEDISATIDCIKALGANVSVEGSTVTVTGNGGICDSSEIEFMCRESGSTMRFFMGLSMFLGISSKFYGSETLRKRPFSVYEDICKNQNILFEKKEDYIALDGRIKPMHYKLLGNISSQFITGLLFGLPLLNGDSIIELIPPVESRSYIDLTLISLEKFGVKVTWENDNILSIKGNQKYVSTNIRVEGDCSNAAFLEAFNLINGKVNVLDVNPETLQGDRVYIDIYKELNSGKPTVDISDCPDLGPVLMAMAAAKNGAYFTGTRRLKMKESDRGTVMCEELSKFGVNTRMDENSIMVDATDLKTPDAILSGHNDHRIVMSLALLCTLTGGSISEAEAVRKSYPGFFDDISKLGIEVIR